MNKTLLAALSLGIVIAVMLLGSVIISIIIIGIMIIGIIIIGIVIHYYHWALLLLLSLLLLLLLSLSSSSSSSSSSSLLLLLSLSLGIIIIGTLILFLPLFGSLVLSLSLSSSLSLHDYYSHYHCPAETSRSAPNSSCMDLRLCTCMPCAFMRRTLRYSLVRCTLSTLSSRAWRSPATLFQQCPAVKGLSILVQEQPSDVHDSSMFGWCVAHWSEVSRVVESPWKNIRVLALHILTEITELLSSMAVPARADRRLSDGHLEHVCHALHRVQPGEWR